MNKTELQRILDNERFDPAVYSLEGGLPNDRLCLSEEGRQWRVYYTERGACYDEQWFASEDDACEELLRRLRELPPSQSRLATAR